MLTFYPLPFWWHEMSPSVPLVWFFFFFCASITSSGTFSILFFANTFFLYIFNLSSLNSTGGIKRLSKASVNTPMLSLFFCNSTYTDLNFTHIVITFNFCTTVSTLLANFFFQWPIFVKCHMGLSLGTRSYYNYMLSICAWTELYVCSDQPPTDFERRNVIGTDHDTDVIYIVICVLK